MIQGLAVTVNGGELRGLASARADHHEERAATYAEQIANMKNANVEPMQYSGGDPMKALEDRRMEHVGNAAEMRFIAAHLDAAETYLLTRSDLARLGIVTDRYA